MARAGIIGQVEPIWSFYWLLTLLLLASRRLLKVDMVSQLLQCFTVHLQAVEESWDIRVEEGILGKRCTRQKMP